MSTNVFSKEDFVAQNNVNLCGKIVKKNQTKKELRFVLSCGHGKKLKKDKNGRFLRNVLTVKFFDKQAQIYGEKFNVGDFVTVTAVAQTRKNPYSGETHLEIWGLAMGPKVVRGRMIQDHNQVNIRGKIVTSAAVNKNLVIVNVFTDAEKKYLNPIKNDNVPTITERFRSITPIGIWCKGDAFEQIKQYTPGTWVDVSGFVDSKFKKIEGEMPVIKHTVTSLKTHIIGDIQRQ